MTKFNIKQLQAEADRLNELIDEATLTVRLDQLMEETVASLLAADDDARRPGEITRESDKVAIHEAPAGKMILANVATTAFRIGHLLAKGRGSLLGWDCINMASADAHLPADAAQRKIVGVQKALQDIFDSETLHGELNWSDGFLRIMCERTANGPIRKITGSVHRSANDNLGKSTIVLVFSDCHGSTETLELTPAQPMRSADNLSLVGNVEDVELVVSVQRVK